MLARTPAKINLFLFVTGRRDDGYHLIYTLFQKIALFDTIEIERSGVEGIALTCPDWLSSGPDNLVYKAASAFFHACDIRPAVNIKLEKEIPAGGGLGGGSSDAAATLKTLNSLYGGPISDSMLHELAASLGADCPFFLLDAPAAIGSGTGTELEVVQTPQRWFVLVMPDFGVSTRWAYENFKLTTGHQDTIFDARAQMDTLLWNNDLEQAVLERYPGIKDIKKKLLELGAEEAMMTGSGSTVFGVFPSEKTACSAVQAIQEGDIRAVAVQSLSQAEVFNGNT